MNILSEMYLRTRKNRLNLGRCTLLDVDQGIFCRVLHCCKIGIFPQFGSCLWKNWFALSENFTIDVSLDVNCGTHPDLDSGLRSDLPRWRSVLSCCYCCCVWYLISTVIRLLCKFLTCVLHCHVKILLLHRRQRFFWRWWWLLWFWLWKYNYFGTYCTYSQKNY